MKIVIHEEANREFLHSIEWYNQQQEELGDKFKEAVVGQTKAILKNPIWFLVEEGAIYKALVPRFPYKILYTISKDENAVIIWSISHLHRNPGYWKNRIE